MCNLLPEVENCCMICPLRIGMLFIAVLAIMTGSFSLSAIEKNSDMAYSNATFERSLLWHWRYVLLNTTSRMKDVGSVTFSIITALINMSLFCMLLGVVLLISTLMGEEGIVQLFVLGMFLLIISSFVVLGAVVFQCLSKYEKAYEACLVSGMDWLTGAAVLLFCLIYLCVWIYFVIVANSYIMNGDD